MKFRYELDSQLVKVEVWKEIHNHESFMVSDAGRIKQVLGDTETIVKQQQDREGHMYVVLDGKRHYVGYTVLKTFVGEPPNQWGTEIRHSMTKGLATKYSRFGVSDSDDKVKIFCVSDSEIYFEDGYGYLIDEDMRYLLTYLRDGMVTSSIEQSFNGMTLFYGDLDIFEHNEVVYKFKLGLSFQELLAELKSKKMISVTEQTNTGGTIRWKKY